MKTTVNMIKDIEDKVNEFSKKIIISRIKYLEISELIDLGKITNDHREIEFKGANISEFIDMIKDNIFAISEEDLEKILPENICKKLLIGGNKDVM